MGNGIILTGDFVPKAGLDPYDPFSDEIRELFHESEYVIVNLETPLTERGKPILKTGKNFRRSPKYAEILKKAGVDCVCLANNHIRDYGDEGVLDTIRYCKEAGLDVVGAGFNSEDAAKPLIKELVSVKVALLNYCEREFSIADKNQAGANPFDLIDAYHTIQDLRSKVDKIIVIYHGGVEYQHYPTPEMVKSFRFMIDIGADSVVAHHAHAYSGYERYKGQMIYYGLGNMFFPPKSKHPKENWLRGIMVLMDFIHGAISCDIVPIDFDQQGTKINVTNSNNYNDVINHIVHICAIIQDNEGFREAWSKHYRQRMSSTLMNISATPRLPKMFRSEYLLSISLSKQRALTMQNLFQCDSHRQSIILACQHYINKKLGVK